MKMLKNIAAPLAFVAASLAIAGPAQAAPMRHGWNDTPVRSAEIRQNIVSLDRAIDRAAARRTISSREAAGLHRQARNVQRLYAQYQRGGLSRAELHALQQRVDAVRLALRAERHDRDGRRG